jgi:hypothetical protein
VEVRNQVLELNRQEVGIKKIAKALRISKNTVRKILRDAADDKSKPKDAPSWAKSVSWESVHESVGRRLCQETVSALFLPMNFMFEEVLAARASGKYLSYVKKLTQSKVLIFDDFGLRNYTHEEATVLVDILEERHRKGSVIVTSQVDPKGWMKLFEDPVIGEAIVDRLINPSQKIQLLGGTYRERLQSALPSGKKVEEGKLLN